MPEISAGPLRPLDCTGAMLYNARVAELTSKRRNALSKSTFGLPGRRAYPMPDKSHAANAKARATQQYKAGHLTKNARDRINAKANRILGK